MDEGSTTIFQGQSSCQVPHEKGGRVIDYRTLANQANVSAFE